jgi:hypothetical protein
LVDALRSDFSSLYQHALDQASALGGKNSSMLFFFHCIPTRLIYVGATWALCYNLSDDLFVLIHRSILQLIYFSGILILTTSY